MKNNIFKKKGIIICILNYIPLVIGIACLRYSFIYFYIADRTQGWPPETTGFGEINYFIFFIYLGLGLILCIITSYLIKSIKSGIILLIIYLLCILYIFSLNRLYSINEENNKCKLSFYGDNKEFWSGLTSSADGSKLTAIIANDCIYTSKNNGSSWVRNSSSECNSWRSITSSADGNIHVAVTSMHKLLSKSGFIYISVDNGTTWLQCFSAGRKNWRAITSSADGKKLAVIESQGYIYISMDLGITWIKSSSAGIRDWNSITSSSDGSKLAVVENNGYIYTSSDRGTTWIKRISAGKRFWRTIVSSSSGKKLAAIESNGYIYTSSNFGVTWSKSFSAEDRQWTSIVSSADGTRLAAVAVIKNQKPEEMSTIFLSTDSGRNWIEIFSTQGCLGAIAASQDCLKLAVVGETNNLEPHRGVLTVCDIGRFIYTTQDGGATWTRRNALPLYLLPACFLISN